MTGYSFHPLAESELLDGDPRPNRAWATQALQRKKKARNTLSEVDLDFLRERYSLLQESIDEAVRNLDGYHKIVGELLNEAETREIEELKERAAKLPESRRGFFGSGITPFIGARSSFTIFDCHSLFGPWPLQSTI